jgi:hypothetical protein
MLERRIEDFFYILDGLMEELMIVGRRRRSRRRKRKMER